jgi:hypothetical protein
VPDRLTFTLSPLGNYIVFDLLVMVLVGFQVWSLVRILRSHVPPARPGAVWFVHRLIAPLVWRMAAASTAVGLVFVY